MGFGGSIFFGIHHFGRVSLEFAMAHLYKFLGPLKRIDTYASMSRELALPASEVPPWQTSVTVTPG